MGTCYCTMYIYLHFYWLKGWKRQYFLQGGGEDCLSSGLTEPKVLSCCTCRARVLAWNTCTRIFLRVRFGGIVSRDEYYFWRSESRPWMKIYQWKTRKAKTEISEQKQKLSKQKLYIYFSQAKNLKTICACPENTDLFNFIGLQKHIRLVALFL